MRYHYLLGSLLVAFGLFASGCGSTNATAPQFEPEIVNSPNQAFSFQATGLTNVSDTLTYRWDVSSGEAVIHPSTSTDAGEVTLRVSDAAGTVLHEGAILPSGDISPPPGEAGEWTLRISFSGYSGSANFELQMQ